MYEIDKFGCFIEDSYDMNKEALSATLFTTGNGYMGVRGSFEEFGALKIQGAFVRGFIDEIIEVCEPFANNEYMKKYYLDEEKLKTFEKQDSPINMHDFLFCRIIIGDKVFYPWDVKIIKHKRILNPKIGVYTREVLFETENGLKTEITYSRFASFNNDHLYCQKIHIKPINHDKEITIISGVDTYRKTGGQIITETDNVNINGSIIKDEFHAINKYKFSAKYDIYHNFPSGSLEKYYENGVYGITCKCDKNKEYTLEKFTYIYTSRDNDFNKEINYSNLIYDNLYNEHLVEYKKCFDICDIKIEGDDEIDGYLRYANYETIISASRNDSIHGISAKSLSGERYNQFVWWDQEIHQLPFFNLTAPNTAKNAILYRYRMLESAKKNAKEAGYDGAKYAFCSSVNGDERVWQYARHPFMQIHINSDVPMGVLNYFDWTDDKEFMSNYGLEMMLECLKFWVSRVEKTERGYEIKKVTGTDEHHPYVNNDAYTNYSVKYIFERFISLVEKFNYSVDGELLKKMISIKNELYVPILKNGMIPQFDGYFDLSKTLESSGSASLKQFQMKSSGLYQYSQIIKQPDVVLLYTFTNIDMDPKYYAVNWDYYEKMCETSSSLTFPVHAIASADNNRMLSFYNYFKDTLKIDIDDIHEVGYQGLHAGCMAGGYYAIMRGIFGLRAKEDYLIVKPNLMPLFKKIIGKCYYHGSLIELCLKDNVLTIKVLNNKEIKVLFKEKEYTIKNMKRFEL